MAPKKRIATKALRKGLSYAVVALLGVLLVSGLQLFKEKRATEPAGGATGGVAIRTGPALVRGHTLLEGFEHDVTRGAQHPSAEVAALQQESGTAHQKSSRTAQAATVLSPADAAHHELLRAVDWQPLQRLIDLTAAEALAVRTSMAEQLCSVLVPAGVTTIAIVGNGPLSMDDHRQSNEHDWVVRFNYMENLLERERADLWVGRTDLLTHSFWQRTEGFYPSQAPLAMAAAKEILLLGTGTSLTPVVSQQFRLSSTAVKQAVKVDVTSFNTAFSSAKAVGFSAGPRTGIPTSGTIVVMASAICAHNKNVKIHIYGMNWSRKQLPMLHFTEKEAHIVLGMESEGMVTIHKPPCETDNLRTCGDVDHYLCREAWQNCGQVKTAMLADMFNSFSFEQLLRVTQAADGELSRDASATKSTSLDAIWVTGSSSAAQQSRYCRLFQGKNMDGKEKSIALVGNGPLSDEQRARISTHDVVVRFNYLNNRLPGERMDVWVTCFGWEFNGNVYWGFAQMAREEAVEALSTNANVVLFGGYTSSSAHHLLRQFTRQELPLDKVLYLDLAYSDEQFYSAYRAVHGNSTGKFLTTGFRVVLATLACKPLKGSVHLFGFNWSPRVWEGHDTALERKVLIEFANQGFMTVHMPPCDGVRRCAEYRDIHDYSVRHSDGFSQ